LTSGSTSIGVINLLRREYLRTGSVVKTFRLYQETRLDRRSQRYESIFALLVVTIVGAVIAGVILDNYKDNKSKLATWLQRMKEEAYLFGIGEKITNIFAQVFNNRNKIRDKSSADSRTIPLIPEIRDFDGTKYRGATLLTGGFPCQPFSVAGQRRGKEDDRYLWPQMRRVINEAKPRWILAGNVPGIFRMALDTVLADLEDEGYATGTFIIPACGLNAPHRRNRIWIVANSIRPGTGNQGREADNQKRRICQDRRKSIRQKNGTISSSRPTSTSNHAQDSINDRMRGGNHGNSRRSKCTLQVERSNSYASDSETSLIRGIRNKGKEKGSQNSDELFGGSHRLSWKENWHEVATRFCRVDDGISDRVHRLKALGNAIVPQVAYEILKNIAWIEKG